MGPKVTGTKFAVGQAVRLQDPPCNGKAGRWNESGRILEVNAGGRSYIVQLQDGPLRNRNEKFLKLETVRRNDGDNDSKDNKDNKADGEADIKFGWQVKRGRGRPPGKRAQGYPSE
jgi:hypothetical protein